MRVAAILKEKSRPFYGGETVASKLKKTLILFIILQPFLDIFWLYQPPISDFLGMSPATIIRILFIAVIGVMFLIADSNKKLNLFFGGYVALLLVYFVFHQWNAGQFHSLVPGNFGYSTFGELFYIVRMVMPLFLIVVTYRTELDNKTLENVVSWLSGLTAGSIVLSNLLGISLGSYLHQWGTGNIFQQYGRQRITGSLLSWFTTSGQGNYYGLASKGFFNHANTVSAMLLMITPMVLYFLCTNFNVKNVILTALQALAGLELGTKAAAYGTVALFGLFVILYLYFTFVAKEFRFRIASFVSLLAIMLVMMGLFHFSPNGNRQASEEQTADIATDLHKESKKDKANVYHRLKKLDKRGDDKKTAKFIEKHAAELALNPEFAAKSYPVRHDLTFWKSILKWPVWERMNYRVLQNAIWKRVSALNGNSKDKVLGFGYTRLSNMGLIERDFVSQYYAMGIIGMLLLVMPYVGILLWAAIMILLHFRRRFTMRNVALGVSCALALGLSVYAGYVMDYLTATLMLAFFMGQLLRGAMGKDENGSSQLTFGHGPFYGVKH